MSRLFITFLLAVVLLALVEANYWTEADQEFYNESDPSLLSLANGEDNETNDEDFAITMATSWRDRVKSYVLLMMQLLY